jgi:hypothetical protein
VEIRSAAHHYRALVGAGLLEQLGECARKDLPRKTCTIISDNNVAPFFGDRVKRSLESADFQRILITSPADEKSKRPGAELDDVDLVASGRDKMFAEISGEPTRLQLQFAGNSLRREERPLTDPRRLVQLSISIG